MPTRKGKNGVRTDPPRSDAESSNETSSSLVDALKLRVRLPSSKAGEAEYARIGPDSPLWHGEMAKRTAASANDGDTDAAREILDDYIGTVLQHSDKTWHGPNYWAYAQYIADAFQKILDGVDPALALGVKNSKAGRRPGTGKTHNREAVAAAFNLLLLNGLTEKQAKSSLKEKIGTSRDFVEKSNKDYSVYRIYLGAARDSAATDEDRDFAAEIIKNGARTYAVEIGAILAARKSR